MITNIKNIRKRTTKRAKKRTRKTASLIFLGVLVFSLAIFLFISNWRISQRRTKLYSQIELLERQIQHLIEENIRIEEEIAFTEEEDFLARIAREGLGLKKPGEQVIIVLPPEEIEPKEQEQVEKSFWQRALDWLKF